MRWRFAGIIARSDAAEDFVMNVYGLIVSSTLPARPWGFQGDLKDVPPPGLASAAMTAALAHASVAHGQVDEAVLGADWPYQRHMRARMRRVEAMLADADLNPAGDRGGGGGAIRSISLASSVASPVSRRLPGGRRGAAEVLAVGQARRSAAVGDAILDQRPSSEQRDRLSFDLTAPILARMGACPLAPAPPKGAGRLSRGSTPPHHPRHQLQHSDEGNAGQKDLGRRSHHEDGETPI